MLEKFLKDDGEIKFQIGVDYQTILLLAAFITVGVFIGILGGGSALLKIFGGK